MRRFAFILLIIILIMIHPVYANSFMINDQIQTKNFTSKNIEEARDLKNQLNKYKKSYYKYYQKSSLQLEKNISAFTSLYTFCDDSYITFGEDNKGLYVQINLKKYKRSLLNAKKDYYIIHSIINSISDNLSDKEKITALNYYFCKNYSYDYDTMENRNNISIHKTLKQHKGICAEFAELNQIFYNYWNIENYIIENNVLDHELNKVVIDGKEYYIDTTWNLNHSDRYDKYLLLTKEEMQNIYPEIHNNKKLPAVWEQVETIIIKYDLCGGIQNSKNHFIYRKDKKEQLYKPTKSGYIFKGWFLGNKKITNTKQLSQNTKLKAKWRKI